MNRYWIKLLTPEKPLTKFFIFLIIFMVAILDMFLKVFGGIWVITCCILIMTFPFIYPLVKYVRNRRKKKESQMKESFAIEYEKKQKEKLLAIFQKNPEFTTHCYECKRFNHNLLHCQMKLEEQRVKEIKVDKKAYCLYWEGTKININNLNKPNHEK